MFPSGMWAAHILFCRLREFRKFSAHKRYYRCGKFLRMYFVCILLRKFRKSHMSLSYSRLSCEGSRRFRTAAEYACNCQSPRIQRLLALFVHRGIASGALRLLGEYRDRIHRKQRVFQRPKVVLPGSRQFLFPTLFPPHGNCLIDNDQSLRNVEIRRRLEKVANSNYVAQILSESKGKWKQNQHSLSDRRHFTVVFVKATSRYEGFESRSSVRK